MQCYIGSCLVVKVNNTHRMANKGFYKYKGSKGTCQYDELSF